MKKLVMILLLIGSAATLFAERELMGEKIIRVGGNRLNYQFFSSNNPRQEIIDLYESYKREYGSSNVEFEIEENNRQLNNDVKKAMRDFKANMSQTELWEQMGKTRIDYLVINFLEESNGPYKMAIIALFIRN